MAGSNTEKPTGKAEQKKNVNLVQPKVDKKQIEKQPVVKKETMIKTEDKEKVETKPVEKKVDKVVIPKMKKETAFVRGENLPVSTKVGGYICKFIKNKTVEKAISDLEEVQQLRKAVPMKGEIPHRKGPMMSGRFPQRAAAEFIILLKSLKGNIIQNDMESPIISEAIANKGTTTRGKGGRVNKKRTHIKIVCSEKKVLKNKIKKNKK
jgi:ribosomal protein L22